MSVFHWITYLIVISGALALHEIGHWAEMKRQGIPTARLTLGIGPSIRLFGRIYLALFPLGASVSPDPDAWNKTSAANRLRVAAGGPVASFICGGLLLVLGLLYPHISKGLFAFATVHFAIGAFNMLPIPPLDGWHILTEALAANNKPLSLRAKMLSFRIGNGLIYAGGGWFIGMMAAKSMGLM